MAHNDPQVLALTKKPIFPTRLMSNKRVVSIGYFITSWRTSVTILIYYDSFLLSGTLISGVRNVLLVRYTVHTKTLETLRSDDGKLWRRRSLQNYVMCMRNREGIQAWMPSSSRPRLHLACFHVEQWTEVWRGEYIGQNMFFFSNMLFFFALVIALLTLNL